MQRILQDDIACQILVLRRRSTIDLHNFHSGMFRVLFALVDQKEDYPMRQPLPPKSSSYLKSTLWTRPRFGNNCAFLQL